MKIPSYFSFTVLFLCHSKLPSLNIHLETNYIMIQNTKSKYNVGWGACMEKSNCSHSEKKRACWIFTHGTTEQAYLNLFSFMNYTWLSSLSYTPRVKNILNDNLLISCQMGKIHSFLQICSWFFINILNDFREMHLGCLWLSGKKYARMLDPTFHFSLSIYIKSAYVVVKTIF